MTGNNLISRDDLREIFGGGVAGDDPRVWAEQSSRLWVRSQDHLAVMSEGASGLHMTSSEVFEAFGLAALLDAYTKGSSILAIDRDEPGGSFVRVRTRLGLTHFQVAEKTGLTLDEVLVAEDPNRRSSIHKLAKICQVLGLDVRRISYQRFE